VIESDEVRAPLAPLPAMRRRILDSVMAVVGTESLTPGAMRRAE